MGKQRAREEQVRERKWLAGSEKRRESWNMFFLQVHLLDSGRSFKSLANTLLVSLMYTPNNKAQEAQVIYKRNFNTGKQGKPTPCFSTSGKSSSEVTLQTHELLVHTNVLILIYNQTQSELGIERRPGNSTFYLNRSAFRTGVSPVLVHIHGRTSYQVR